MEKFKLDPYLKFQIRTNYKQIKDIRIKMKPYKYQRNEDENLGELSLNGAEARMRRF